MFNAFVSTCAVAFFTTHGKNKMRSFDNEDLFPVASLCGVVVSPYWFTKCFIGITGSIWAVMYINEKCIYYSETRVCNIIECAIVLNVRHVTSSWLIISWWSGAANDCLNPHIERPSEKFFKVICVTAPVWILSVYHYPNSSTFPNIAWNIYILSLNYSVVIFSITQSFVILE